MDQLSVLIIRILLLSAPFIATGNGQNVRIPNYDFHHGSVSLGCSKGWQEFGTACWKLISVPSRFSAAAIECERYGSSLAMHIRGFSRIQLLGDISVKLGNDEDFWIGAKSLSWLDGAKMNQSESFWAPGQPNLVTGNCVKVQSSQQWSNMSAFCMESCDKRLPYLCMKTPKYSQDSYTCKNSEVIPQSWKCDDVADCDDYTDEIYCRTLCSEDQVGLEGEIKHRLYLSDIYCYWTISAPPGTYIKFIITFLDTERDFDVIRIFSGGLSEASAEKIESLSGQVANLTEILTPSNMAVVTFTSDSSERGRGFLILWKAVGLPEDSLQVTAFLKYRSTASYPANTVLLPWVWRFVGDGGPFIITVMDLDLPKMSSIVVYDGNHPDEKLTLTGNMTEPFPILTSSSELSFHFINDKIGKGRVKVAYKSNCQFVYSTDSGYIKAPLNIFYKTMSCQVLLETSRGSSVALEFLGSRLLEDDSDFVKIFALNRTKHEVAQHPGDGFTTLTGIPDILHVESNMVRIEFNLNPDLGDQPYLKYTVACPELNLTAENTRIIGTYSTRYKSAFSVQCLPGNSFVSEEYKQLSKVIMKCDWGGNWNVRTSPTCQPICCGFPPQITNGHIESATGVCYRDNTTYVCNPKLALIGNGSIQCKADGRWEQAPQCQGEQCTKYDKLQNGNISLEHLDGISRGSVVMFTCNEGFDLEGSPRAVCRGSTWSEPLPQCIARRCYIPFVPHGRVSLNKYSLEVGNSTRVLCNPGYKPAVSKVISCLANQSLDYAPVCQDVDECEKNVCRRWQCKNTVGSYRCICDAGYISSRFSTNDCLDVDECALSLCDHRCVNTEGGYKCDCDAGYALYTANGTESFYLPLDQTGLSTHDRYHINHTCVLELCLTLDDLDNGIIIGRKLEYRYGDMVKFLCDFGFILNGSAKITCGAHKKWSDSLPQCLESTCNDVTHLLIGPGSRQPVFPSPVPTVQFLGELSASCGQEFSVNELKFLCDFDQNLQTYKFSGGLYECPVIDCGKPESLRGSRDVFPLSTLYNSSFTFECQPWFERIGTGPFGDYTVWCLADGLWDFGSLECVGGHCSDPGTSTGARQIAVSYEVGHNVTYNCTRSGYTLTDSTPLTCVIEADRAEWSKALPECVDTTPPHMLCPKSPLEVSLLHSLSEAGYNPPTYTDSSGFIAAVITDPLHFSFNDIVSSPLTVNYTTTDSSGNTAMCLFDVVIRDNTPPSLSCPKYLIVTLHGPSYEDILYLNESSEISATDNSGQVVLSFTPPILNLTEGNHGEAILVHVTATDPAGLEDLCSFFVVPEVESCAPASLVVPDNVTLSCQRLESVFSCQATCPVGMYFINDSQVLNYTCIRGQSWQPSKKILPCIAPLEVAEYSVTLLFISSPMLPIPPNTKESCFTKIKTQFDDCPCLRRARLLLESNIADSTNGEVTSVLLNMTDMIPEEPGVFLRPRLGMFPSGLTEEVYNVAMDAIVSSIPEVVDMLKLSGVGCGDFALSNAENNELGIYECPVGTVVISADERHFCVPCAPGSRFVEDHCELCSPGTYQNQSGQTYCHTCPPNTLSPQGAIKMQDCAATCPSGFYSKTTVQPCIPCGKGTYSTDPTTCVSCPSHMTTRYPASTGLDNCIPLCAPGNFSSVGYSPCEPCPLGYYSTGYGSTTCRQCPINRLTLSKGSSSQSDCVKDYDSPCVNAQSRFVERGRVVCICYSGYTGELCETEINECDSNPCYNGGVCVDLPENFFCNCTNGTYGDQCAENVDDCVSHDCINDGMCHDLINDYECLCPVDPNSPAYLPPRCELRLSICETNPCKNGGECIERTSSRRYCKCPKGFNGIDCELNEDECTSQPCYHNGICIDGLASFQCLCTTDYTGAKCQTRLSLCDQMDCGIDGHCVDQYMENTVQCVCSERYQFDGLECVLVDVCAVYNCNKGTCVDVSGLPVCWCHPGYTGPNCSIALNMCESIPCLNGGNCSGDPFSYTCTCSAQYTGVNCEVDVNECLVGNTMCGPHSDCMNEPGGYRCICHHGYTGLYCQEDIDECVVFPCRNKGTCENTAGSYNCRCVQGWEGAICSDLVPSCRDDTCLNHAECFNLPREYYCGCDVDSFGKNCNNLTHICANNPCRNGGSCHYEQENPSVLCSCPAGFSGVVCEFVLDWCSQDPCQNGGVCQPVLDHYVCICPYGFTGGNCEQDINDCALDPCPAGSTCMDLIGHYSCKCPAGKMGLRCKKALDNNFDYIFYLGKSLVELYYPIPVGGATALSLSMWLRLEKPGHILSVYGFSVRSMPEPFEMLSITVTNAIAFVIYLPDAKNLTSFVPLDLDSDPVWTHLAISINLQTGHVEIYFSGLRKTATLPPNIKQMMADYMYVKLGQVSEDKRSFIGSLSQVFVWGRVLSYKLDINPQNKENKDPCTSIWTDDLLLNWADFHVIQSTLRRQPAGCSAVRFENAVLDVCPAVRKYSSVYWTERKHQRIQRGTMKYAASAEDCKAQCLSHPNCKACSWGTNAKNPDLNCDLSKNTADLDSNHLYSHEYFSYFELLGFRKKCRVEVLFCPGDVVVHTKERIISVAWEEPVFKHYQNITQSYISGSLFTWGDYLVQYVATRDDSPPAICQFTILIYYWDCPDVSSLTRRCSYHPPHTSCQSVCWNENVAPCSTLPLLTSCSPWAHYDPVDFTTDVNQCAVTQQMQTEVNILIPYKKITNTITVRDYLVQSVKDAITTVLCQQELSCSFLHVNITSCLINNGCSVYAQILLRTSLITESGRTIHIQEYVQKNLDESIYLFDFSGDSDISIVDGYAETFQVHVIPDCPAGSMPIPDQEYMCVQCCIGTFYRIDSKRCEPCPRGTYQSLSGQLTCETCPSGTNTAGPGSTSVSDCKRACKEGEYLDNLNQCALCDFGFYQDEPGQFHCKSCPLTQTTHSKGAINATSCYDFCLNGEDMQENGQCVPCHRDSYIPPGHTSCRPCPLNTITDQPGATNITQCNMVACDAGYHDVNGTCLPCPLDTYQPEHWQTECIPCEQGYGTKQQAATHASQCLFFCGDGEQVIPYEKKCEPCRRGSFKNNTENKYGFCKPCPDPGYITPSEGATGRRDCHIANCSAGSYTTEANRCELCPLGMYQGTRWQHQCSSCPHNTSTASRGATSLQACKPICPSGYEMKADMKCYPCEVGFYKNNSRYALGNCSKCRQDWTTEAEGSESLSACSKPDCSAGKFWDIKVKYCVPCPLNTYRPEKWQNECINCSKGYSTEHVGAANKTMCRLYCEAGEESISDVCVQCRYGYYKDKAGVRPCVPCPEGRLTPRMGSTDIEDCTYWNCSAGEEYDINGGTCVRCGRGSYRNGLSVPYCTQCPDQNFTTEYEGSVTMHNCTFLKCEPGSYFDEDDAACIECPVGTYQPLKWQNKCLQCPANKPTKFPGSRDERDCGMIDDCLLRMDNCSKNATCHFHDASFNCTCNKWFVGDGWSCTHVCELQFCENGGTCFQKKNSEAVCICPKYYIGDKCETRSAGRDASTMLILGSSVSVSLLIFIVGLAYCVAVYSSKKNRKTSPATMPPGDFLSPFSYNGRRTLLPVKYGANVYNSDGQTGLVRATGGAPYTRNVPAEAPLWAHATNTAAVKTVNPMTNIQPLYDEDSVAPLEPPKRFYKRPSIFSILKN